MFVRVHVSVLHFSLNVMLHFLLLCNNNNDKNNIGFRECYFHILLITLRIYKRRSEHSLYFAFSYIYEAIFSCLMSEYGWQNYNRLPWVLIEGWESQVVNVCVRVNVILYSILFFLYICACDESLVFSLIKIVMREGLTEFQERYSRLLSFRKYICT